MPLVLSRALRIDVDRLRWWEWDLWAADEAHLTTEIVAEFKAEYRYWQSYTKDANAALPNSRREVQAATKRKRVRRRR